MNDKDRSESRDLKDVMRTERGRGKRRTRQAAEDERLLRSKLRDALNAATEREFIDRLRRNLGVTESSPNFSAILQIWREQR